MQNNVLCELMTMKSDKENRGQGENPVFRITKKPPSETRVENRVICHRFSMALNFHD